MSDNEAADILAEHTHARTFFWSLGVFAGIVLIAIIVVAEWWSIEPKEFNVTTEAVKRGKQKTPDKLPVGYVYTNTLAHIAEVLMDKPGGYITNDASPPGMFLDNITSWEYGALVMLRDATSALRNHFARSQSQSAEDTDLAKAEPYFYYERNSWALPSTETEYDKGIWALDAYMTRLNDPKTTRPAQFYSRADNLWQYIEVVIKRLGGLSTRLSASTERHLKLDEGLEDDPLNQISKRTASIRITTWMEIDNVFYEARGSAWALLHILKAIKYDFRAILLDKRAMKTVEQMIHNLENAISPIMSPMILNGNGFGLFANYSLTMANYIARANAAALDLRDVMNRG